MEKAKGHCVKYGDNVDTDVIIPARYLAIQDKAELATHAMEDIDQHFHDCGKELWLWILQRACSSGLEGFRYLLCHCGKLCQNLL